MGSRVTIIHRRYSAFWSKEIVDFGHKKGDKVRRGRGYVMCCYVDVTYVKLQRTTNPLVKTEKTYKTLGKYSQLIVL